MAQQCCHNSLIMCLKEIRSLKYVYLLEGVVFIGVSLAILPSTGMKGMLVSSVAATTLFTGFIGAWRVTKLSKMGWKPLLWDWQLPLLRLLAVLVPLALAMGWLLRDQSVWLQLLIPGALLALIGAWALFRYALPFDLTVEMVQKMPCPFLHAARVFIRVACKRDPCLANPILRDENNQS
jgi:hypothetical protein